MLSASCAYEQQYFVRRMYYLFWLAPVLLLWANVHGYFIVGLAIIAVYGVFTLLGRTPLRDRRRLVVTAALICLFATTLTPQGPSGVLYAFSFLDARDFGASAIVEWQSPDFHSPEFLTFFLLIGVTILAGIHRAPGWTRVVAVGGILAGLFAVRAIGIGAVLVLPALLLSRPTVVGALNLASDHGSDIVDRGSTSRRLAPWRWWSSAPPHGARPGHRRRAPRTPRWCPGPGRAQAGRPRLG